ncbi:MAG: NB-ARC domain-containing protein [Cyclobacteriaceae bacterium]
MVVSKKCAFLLGTAACLDAASGGTVSLATIGIGTIMGTLTKVGGEVMSGLASHYLANPGEESTLDKAYVKSVEQALTKTKMDFIESEKLGVSWWEEQSYKLGFDIPSFDSNYTIRNSINDNFFKPLEKALSNDELVENVIKNHQELDATNLIKQIIEDCGIKLPDFRSEDEAKVKILVTDKFEELFNHYFLQNLVTDRKAGQSYGLRLQQSSVRYLKSLRGQVDDIERKIDELNELRTALGIARETHSMTKELLDKVDGKLKKEIGFPPVDPAFFIGRDDDLEKIHERLFAGKIILLVNGRGGVGKTSLASKYYHTYKNEYARIIWATRETSIADALINLASDLGVQFDPQATAEQQLRSTITALANLEKPSLLVIDNVNDEKDLAAQNNNLRRCSNLHILITTRVKDDELGESYAIEGLGKAESIVLFKNHYPKLSSKEEGLVLQIREAVYANTLVMELLAKNLSAQRKASREGYSVEGLLRDLQEKGLLGLEKTSSVAIEYQSLSKADPVEVIAAMYDLLELTPQETEVLTYFALLPSQSIPYPVYLERIFQSIEGHWPVLIQLNRKGWLDYDELLDAFRCSPVVQEIVWKSESKNFDINPLARVLIDQLNPDQIHVDNYIHSRGFGLFAETIIERANQYNFNIGLLMHHLGNLSTDIGELRKAYIQFERYRKINEALCQSYPDDPDFKNGLAISYEKLGQTHSSLGNLKEALGYFEQRSAIGKELYEAYPDNVSFKNGLAISYVKLAFCYKELKDDALCCSHFVQARDIWRELTSQFPEFEEFQRNYSNIQDDISQHGCDGGEAIA